MASFSLQIRVRVPNHTQQQLGGTIEAQNIPSGKTTRTTESNPHLHTKSPKIQILCLRVLSKHLFDSQQLSAVTAVLRSLFHAHYPLVKNLNLTLPRHSSLLFPWVLLLSLEISTCPSVFSSLGWISQVTLIKPLLKDLINATLLLRSQELPACMAAPFSMSWVPAPVTDMSHSRLPWGWLPVDHQWKDSHFQNITVSTKVVNIFYIFYTISKISFTDIWTLLIMFWKLIVL